MAITNYKAINYTTHHIEEHEVPDGTGGFDTVYVIGDSFQGTCVRSSEQEQQTAGVRGDTEEQYSLTVPKDEPVKRNDILMFEDDGEQIFLRVKTRPQKTPEQSTQAGWKGFRAGQFEPREIRVVDSEEVANGDN